MIVQDCMKKKVISIHVEDSIKKAASIFVDFHIGTLPVVKEDSLLLGLLQLRDVLTLVMPDFLKLVEDFDFIEDFGAVENRHPDEALFNKPVKQIMQLPVSVEASSGLLRAFSLLYHHNLSDLPVVDNEDRLIGIVSRVDLGTALLSEWSVAARGESP